MCECLYIFIFVSFQTDLDTVKVKGQGEGDTTVQVAIDMPFDIRTLECPTHKVKVKVGFNELDMLSFVVFPRLKNIICYHHDSSSVPILNFKLEEKYHTFTI